jgi:hypothetical protein
MSCSRIAQRSLSDQLASRSAGRSAIRSAIGVRVAQRSQSIPIPSDAYQGEAKSEKTCLPGVPGVFVLYGAELGKRGSV